MSKRIRGIMAIVAAIAAVVLLNVGQARAAGCGFGGLLAVAPVTDSGFVILYAVPFPFGVTTIAEVALGTPGADACMDIFRDAVLGPFPVNFLAVFAADAGPCAAGTCAAPVAFCSPVTFCLAFP